MIDSGATGNFVSGILVRVQNLPTVGKKEPYKLRMANGSEALSGDVNRETIPLDIAFQRYYKEVTFNIVRMANYYIILGIPQLKKQNLIINWKTGTFTLREPSNITSSGHTHQQRTMVHKKSSRRTTTEYNTVTSNKDGLERGSDSIDTEKGQPVKQHKRNKGKDVPLNIPKEYFKYTQLFQEEVDAKALPKHQPRNHEIELEPGKEPTFGPIYALLEKKLQVLREYIAENPNHQRVTQYSSHRRKTGACGYALTIES